MYAYAKRDNDDRASTAYVSSSDNRWGRIGIYYDFVNLPDELWVKVNSDIRTNLSIH